MLLGKRENKFNYFNEFVMQAGFAKQIVELLTEYLYNFDKNKSDEKMKEIHKLENNADKILHDLKKYLLKDFLPPIEREDILDIANGIDDLVDNIDEIVIDLNIYNIIQIREDIFEIIKLLDKTILKLIDTLTVFKNMKNTKEIHDNVILVNQLEEQADRLYENAIKTLYQKEKKELEILKWTKIYEIIEECFDCCERTANLVEDVVTKNS